MLKVVYLKPYKPKLLQTINEDDFDCHIEFCEWYLIRNEAGFNFLKTVFWFDKASFKFNSRIKYT